jgi:hypothetical protein
MNKKMLVVLSIIILGIALTSFLRMYVYVIRSDSGGSVFWKADEAYIVASGSSRGYRFRYITYPWIALKEYLNAPPFPDEHRVSDIYVRITPSSVERQEVDFGTNTGNTPRLFTPFDDGLYAQCPGVVLCKWIGNQFRRATEEEQKKIGGTDGLNQDPRKDAINGWKVRSFPYLPGEHFDIDVGKTFTITAKNQAAPGRVYPSISVDLLRPGQIPENIYNVDGVPRRVNESEYKQIFGSTHNVENE